MISADASAVLRPSPTHYLPGWVKLRGTAQLFLLGSAALSLLKLTALVVYQWHTSASTMTQIDHMLTGVRKAISAAGRHLADHCIRASSSSYS
jgi:hypothetical protein